ncbi:MAG: polysaccharide pyruvyl transferase family protein [Saccharospirillum sp.]|uniref:polysaccharide pyruvyl transferase family protein n=1 Tax=Saccharospirillum sp. TaxID=2033801 RepID=UPI003296840B
MIDLKSYAREALRSVRVESKSNLFWWQGPPLNFGDWIGPYIFKELSGLSPTHKKPSNKSLTSVYVTVGSLASWFCEDSIVWGSGIIDRDQRFWKPREVCAVRGAYTRGRFLDQGFDCPEIYGDPAILLSDLYNPDVAKQYKLGVIPHYCNLAEATSFFSKYDAVNVIDVRTNNVESIVQELMKCEVILSSSLHGLILGNAYSIPSAQVEFATLLVGDGVKFLDYFSAFCIEPPVPLTINNSTGISELFDYVRSYPQPNTKKLMTGLYRSCPFNSNKLV